jgi:hypothetical protein
LCEHAGNFRAWGDSVDDACDCPGFALGLSKPQAEFLRIDNEPPTDSRPGTFS